MTCVSRCTTFEHIAPTFERKKSYIWAQKKSTIEREKKPTIKRKNYYNPKKCKTKEINKI